MPSRHRDQEERSEELSSPGALRDCKEECKLSWWGEDRKSKQDLPGKLGCRLRVEEKGLILRSGILSEGTGKGGVCSSESVSKCKINANWRSEICHLPVHSLPRPASPVYLYKASSSPHVTQAFTNPKWLGTGREFLAGQNPRPEDPWNVTDSCGHLLPIFHSKECILECFLLIECLQS